MTLSEGAPDDREEPRLPLRRAARRLLTCVWFTLVLLGARRIHQPRNNVGRLVRFADGTAAAVYRETIVDRPPAADPAVLIVCFRLRWIRAEWGHALFRLESQLNTVLFAGFPGLVSKLWLRHDERGVYRGIYEWDGSDLAVAYVRALWWVLSVVSERCSIHYVALPGLARDVVLDGPALAGGIGGVSGDWWRPVACLQDAPSSR